MAHDPSLRPFTGARLPLITLTAPSSPHPGRDSTNPEGGRGSSRQVAKTSCERHICRQLLHSKGQTLLISRYTVNVKVYYRVAYEAESKVHAALSEPVLHVALVWNHRRYIGARLRSKPLRASGSWDELQLAKTSLTGRLLSNAGTQLLFIIHMKANNGCH